MRRVVVGEQIVGGQISGEQVAAKQVAGEQVAGDQVIGLDGCARRGVDQDRVDTVRRSLVAVAEAGALADLFRLLGDPTRVRLLYALLEAGELCVCDLAATTDIAETSASHALRLLRTAGIVRNRRHGRKIYYRLADAHVRLLLDLSAEHLRHGKDG